MATHEQLISQLRQLLDRVPPALRSISDEQAASGSGPDKWSAKQELGHLLDSAIVNHYRWVRVLSEENPTLPGYDGPNWVSLHNYQQRDWADLIDTWQRLNEHMLMLAEGISASGWQRPAIFDAQARYAGIHVERLHPPCGGSSGALQRLEQGGSGIDG